MTFDTPVGCECNECKRCKNRIKAKRWREENKKKTSQYYIDNKDRISEVSHKWKEENKDKTRKYQKEYRQRPEEKKKVQARTKVRSAIHSGHLERESCAVCGINENVHAHHKDYENPFDIVWLCVEHHREAHSQNTFAD